MSSTDLPFRPFSFQPKDTTNSWSARHMEISIPPNTNLPPPRFAESYDGRDTPSIPIKSPRRSRIWNEVTSKWETVIQDIPSHPYPPQRVGSPNFQAPPSPRSPSFQIPPSPRSPSLRIHAPPPPTPPMTKSSQKILQLTGFDPRFERALPLEHQQLSPTQPARPEIPLSPTIRSISSKSTSSFYSQAESGLQYEQAGSPKYSSTSIPQSSNSEGEYLTPSIYNVSEPGSKTSNLSLPNRKTRLSNSGQAPLTLPSPSEARPQPQPRTEEAEEAEEEPLPLPHFPANPCKSTDSNEMVTLPEILVQESIRLEGGEGKGGEEKPEKDTGSASKHSIPPAPPLVPSPLTIQINAATQPFKTKDRPKPSHITLETEKRKPSSSLFRTAKDSFEWGIYDLGATTSTSPSSSRRLRRSSRQAATSPVVSPLFSMESDHLSLPPPLGSHPDTPGSRRRRFGAGARHPLKSPFPFTGSSALAGGGGGAGIAEEGEDTEGEEGEDEAADTMPSPSTSRTFKRRVSSTIKHLAESPLSASSSKRSRSKSESSSKSKSKSKGTGRSSSSSHNGPPPPSSEKLFITNGARRADGPATPIPPKNGFMEGVMRGRTVLGKVGKSVVGTSKEEKRRESLKKRIVVVGVTDQSPDGRVAEWL